MAVLGALLRRRRFEGPGGRSFLLALDHGLPAGPLDGIQDPSRLVRDLRDAPVTGTILNPGMVRHVASDLKAERALIVHLSAGTLLGPRPTSKVASGSVAGGVALGADAVSVQIHFGDPNEDRMLAAAGRIVRDARSFDLPTLVMAHLSDKRTTEDDMHAARHAARAAAEIGADIVQLNYLGPAESIPKLIEGCPVPLLLGGGPRSASPDAFLARIRAAIVGGAAGITVGRNLFQHPNPREFAMRIGEAVFRDALPVVGAEVPS
jgi:DhnA family fructose-bisphosphate aldolase class Ia